MAVKKRKQAKGKVKAENKNTSINKANLTVYHILKSTTKLV